MPVTFYDLDEAKEYALQKSQERFSVYITHTGDKYIVELGRKQRAKSAGLHWYDEETGEHHSLLPPKASTTTKLHELGHAELGHTGSPETFEELIERELGAELYAYEKMGRDLTHRTINQIAVSVARRYKVRPNIVFNAMKKALDKEGYELDDEDNHNLWWNIREACEKRKQEE